MENRLSASRHATLSSSQFTIWIVVAWSFASTLTRWYLNMGDVPSEEKPRPGEGRGYPGQFQIKEMGGEAARLSHRMVKKSLKTSVASTPAAPSFRFKTGTASRQPRRLQ